MKNKKTLITILCSIGIALVTLVLLIPFICSVITSLQNFTLRLGLFGSPFVGFKNYSLIFEADYMPILIKNSLITGVLGLLIGSAYVYVSSLAISSSKNPFLKSFLTIFFVIPAIVPASLFYTLFPAEMLTGTSALSLFVLPMVASLESLRLAGLVVIAAYFIKNNVFKESLKCMLLFVAIKLICLLTSDLEIVQRILSYGSINQYQTFSGYTYNALLQGGNTGFSSSVNIARVILQFLPAVGACFLLFYINKKDEKNALRSDTRFLPAAVAVLAPLVLLVLILITGSSQIPHYLYEKIPFLYLNEFVYAFLPALLVTIVAYLLALATRYSKTAGFIALTLLTLTAGSLIGSYVLISTIHLNDTLLGPIFMNMSAIPVLALILSFILYRENSIKSNITAIIMAFSVMFGRCWGNYIPYNLTLFKNEAIFPISLSMRHIEAKMQYAYFAQDSAAVNTYSAKLFLSTVPYILIPLLVIALGLLICAIIYIIKTKKKAQQ